MADKSIHDLDDGEVLCHFFQVFLASPSSILAFFADNRKLIGEVRLDDLSKLRLQTFLILFYDLLDSRTVRKTRKYLESRLFFDKFNRLNIIRIKHRNL